MLKSYSLNLSLGEKSKSNLDFDVISYQQFYLHSKNIQVMSEIVSTSQDFTQEGLFPLHRFLPLFFFVQCVVLARALPWHVFKADAFSYNLVEDVFPYQSARLDWRSSDLLSKKHNS